MVSILQSMEKYNYYPNHHGTKLITNVLYIPDIYQNMLSMGQPVKKGYKERLTMIIV